MDLMELILSGNPLIIDKDSPDNLSDRDKPVYFEHQELRRKYPDWIPSHLWKSWYNKGYLPSDHFGKCREVISALHKYNCSLCQSHPEPKIPHHNNYKCLWREELGDLTYICKNDHEIIHNIWPEVNCKGAKYAGSMIIHTISCIHRELAAKAGISVNEGRDFFIDLIKDCASLDRELRESARTMIPKTILMLLDKKYHYSLVGRCRRRTFLAGDLFPEKSLTFKEWIQEYN